MGLALTAVKADIGLRNKELILSAVASGNYVTGGDTINLTVIADPNHIGPNCQAGYPGKIDDYSVEQMPVGYGGELIPGTTLANWKLKIFTTSNTELAAGAYPAAITGDKIFVRFKGPKLQL